MALIHLNNDPNEQELRTFGRWLPAFLVLLCAIFYWRTSSWTVVGWIAGVGSVYNVLFLVAESWRKPMFLGWLYLTYPIGWFISHTVLLVIYLLVLTPIGWLLRLSGRDPLQRTLETDKTSYWEPVEPTNNKERYFQQF